MPIYKYLPKKYVAEFMEQGNVLFRSLTYFIDEHDEQTEYPVRVDKGEDHVLFSVPDNAKLFVDGKEISYIPDTLEVIEKLVNPETYFVFCCSNKLDEDLYKEFKADSCIEILDVEGFSNRLNNALNIATLKHEKITYYDKTIDEAEKDLLLYKDKHYAPQDEYRFYFQAKYSKNRENYHWASKTETGLKLFGRITQVMPEIGAITDIAKVHTIT